MRVYIKKKARQRCVETDRERVGICGCTGQGKAMTGLECRGVQRSGMELTKFFFDGPSSSLMAQVLL
jgi:hypothetical protein